MVRILHGFILEHIDFIKQKNGCPSAKLVEPNCICRVYSFRWIKPPIDLAELARLRFQEGWTLHRLMKYFGCGLTDCRELTHPI